jgi:phytoene dehydrogenase-like protein
MPETKNFDVIVAGGGVNGLACAAVLAREGLSVCVVERNPWVGGGAVTREVTLPGFKHDLYGSSHVWIQCNEDFKSIQPELERFGLKYLSPNDHITGHPDKSGGPGIIIYRSIDKTCETIARYSKADAARYRKVHDDFALVKDGFLKAFFSPPSPPSTLARALETSHEGLRRLQEFSLSARAWVEMNFTNDFVKAVMLNWALAPQILPEQEGAGQSFYIMIPAIHVYGQAIPQGGSQELPNAMARYIEAHGGKVMTSCELSRFVIENGRAIGVQLADGTTLSAKRAVVSALEPKQTFLKFVGEDQLTPDFARLVKGFSFGKISICRIHLALSEPPRFANGDDMSRCLFHRIVDSMPQMIRFYSEIAMGIPPSDPFLWSACWIQVVHPLVAIHSFSILSSRTGSRMAAHGPRSGANTRIACCCPNCSSTRLTSMSARFSARMSKPAKRSKRRIRVLSTARPTAASASRRNSATSGRSRAMLTIARRSGSYI